MDGSPPNGCSVVESPNILGQIYRAVNCKDLYKQMINTDHLNSV
jgi:hypothetical protein